MGEYDRPDRFGIHLRVSEHGSSKESVESNSAFFTSISDTLSSTATILVELLVCQNNAFSKRLRFRTLPIHPTSKPERHGAAATALSASAVSHLHTVLTRLSSASVGQLVLGAASCVEMTLPPAGDTFSRPICRLL